MILTLVCTIKKLSEIYMENISKQESMPEEKKGLSFTAAIEKRIE